MIYKSLFGGLIPTAKQVELIDIYNFVKVALDKNFETFVIYMVALEASVAMPIYSS